MPESRTIIAADVGGTHTRFALAQCTDRDCRILKRSDYPSRGYAAFDLVVEAFLREPEVVPHASRLSAACFAVAGPVEHGCVQLTNLTWHIDEHELAQHLSIPHVSVINDFAAAALGIERLPAGDLVALQVGAPVKGADRVVIGAGTGLGVAWLTCEDGVYRVHPSEGGHADFAPIDALQDDLLRYMRREFSHVSSERVLSGPGLARILAFLADESGREISGPLRDAMGRDPARAVSEFGLAHSDELAVRALDLFAAAYGAFAGNIALIALAHGGVYIAGGIAPKIAAKLEDGTFIRAFKAKGRFDAVLASIPVHVVMNEQLGLLGAIAEAARIARG